MKKIQVFVLLLIFSILPSSSLVKGNIYSTGSKTASGGSKYELYVELETNIWEREETYIVAIGIEPTKWGKSISDFHDIILYFSLADGKGFDIIDETSGYGEVNSIGQKFENLWSVTPVNYYPDTFSIFLGSTFREDKSWATDPQTDDGWNKVVDIYLYDTIDIDDPNINFPPQINSPPDIVYEINSANQTIKWNATDNNPSSYRIERDGVEISAGAWESDVPIEISVDNLNEGIYIYKLSVTDSEGLTSQDIVEVKVIGKPRRSSEDESSYLFNYVVTCFILMAILRNHLLIRFD